MRWPLHVIGASVLMLLAWVGACATVPSKIPLSPWRPPTSYAMIEAAARLPAEHVAVAEPTEADLREQLRYWRELRTWQQEQIGREVERLARPASTPVRRQPSRSLAAPTPRTGVWSATAEAERQRNREWVEAELRRRGAL